MNDCHIVAEPGGRDSLCGVRDPLPVVALKHAAAHKYEQDRCTACYEAAELSWMLVSPYVPAVQGSML